METTRRASERRVEMEALVETWHLRVDRLVPSEAAYEGARRKEEEARREVDRLRAVGLELAAARQSAELARDRADALREEARRGTEDLDRVGTERDRVATALAAVELRLGAAPALEASRAAVDRELRTAGELLRQDTLRVGTLQAEVEEAERRVAEAEEAAGRRGEYLTEREHRRSLARWLSGTFRESVQTLEQQLLSSARNAFDRHLARFFATLIEDPGLLARLDASFSPEVEIAGEWTPPEALSGGERTALALAYRLALGQVVREAGRLRLETLLLDEPTDGFSPEQVQRVGELLEELAIPQVLLVSHEAGLESVADHVVRVTKAGGVSRLTGDGVATLPEEEGSNATPPRSRPTRLDRPPDAPPAT